MSSSPIMKSGEDRQSLITNSSRSTVLQAKKRPSFQTILLLSLMIALTVVLIISFIGFIATGQDTKVVPIKVSIPWFDNQDIIMEVGTSRIFEPDLYSGYDNRAFNNFKQVTERSIEWSVRPEGIATVDRYGRVHAVKQGECKLTLVSKANDQAKDQRTIKVIKSRTDIDKVPTRIVNFTKGAVPTFQNLQKLVDRLTNKQVIDSPEVPATVKQAAKNPNATYNNTVIVGDVTWTIQQYADGSPRQYVLRNSTLQGGYSKDRLQYFIGDRYLPSPGTSVVMIETDNKNGLWVVSSSGAATHIRMQKMSYRQKAQMMNEATDKYVLRCGLASGADFDGVKWQQEVSDNDGLWTSMYAAGELMKYAVLKRQKADPVDINTARYRALTSLKAVLMTANVAGRQGIIKAKIRHLNNTRLGDGVFYSKQYLLEGKQNLREIYAGTPSDGVKFFGVDAGKQFQDTLDYVPGKYKYSFLPLNKDDWSTTGAAATTQKHLDGFMSRTFIVQAAGHRLPGGLSFQRSKNSTHKVVSGAHTLYDYTDNDHPQLTLGNKPIPEVLKSILKIDGVQYDASDIIYKGDTSTDEVVGHIFIYKIAYDILDDNDSEQKQLKQLIRQTMRNFCQQLINNGYTMVDATGQATKWTKLYKEFISSDYTIEDGHLKALQLLMSFKVAYYVTGQRKWKDEYDLLTKDNKFNYGELMGKMWDRWVWAFTRGNDTDFQMYKLDYSRNPSAVEIDRHVLYQTHFSDEEEAYLAYYLAFQLEDDKWLLDQYRKGLNGYWHSISKSQNPLWYYIYQLAYPNTPINDSYGQDVRQAASWQLNRHMIDTREYQAYIKGSRPDVIAEGTISVDPYKIIGTRTSQTDKMFVNDKINKLISPSFDPAKIYEVRVLPADERSIHKFNGATFQNIDHNHNPNNMQPSTTFTLPYWMGVYHGMIQYQ